MVEPLGVAHGIGARPSAPLDGHHGAPGSHRPGQGHCEQSGPGEEVGHPLPLLRGQAGQHGVGQDGGGPWVDLPEHPGADPEPLTPHPDVDTIGTTSGPAVHHQTGLDPWGVGQGPPARLHRDHGGPAIGRGGHLHVVGPPPDRPAHTHPVDLVGGQGAVGDRLEVVGPVAVEPHPPGAVDGEPHPGAPPQSTGSTGHLLDHHRHVDPGQSSELLGHQGLLQIPLGREGDVLPVAPPTPPGPGQGTGRLDPVGPTDRARRRRRRGGTRPSPRSPRPPPVRRAGHGGRTPPDRPRPGPRTRLRRRWPR